MRALLLLAAMLCASLALAAPALASPYAQNLGHMSVEFTTATLYASVGDDSGSGTVEWYFEYAKTEDFGSSSTTPTGTAGAQNEAVSSNVTNLESDTTYYYRVVVMRGGETFRTDPSSFKTKTHVPPTATTQDATNVSWDHATMNGTTSADSHYYFEWGTSPGALTSKSDSINSSGAVNHGLQNLPENTTYYFHVVATKENEPDAVGATKSFTTLLSPGNRDDDGDGFKNSEDQQCPNQAGPAAGPYNAKGCPLPPDSDGDGFPDNYDSCPNQAGVAQGTYNQAGCPVPNDADGDSYPDTVDPCPNTAGVQNGEAGAGCPRHDEDGDGYFDSEDECNFGPSPEYTVGGPATPENGNRQGCPINDEDKDGVADIHDKCQGNEKGDRVRPVGSRYPGCTKMGVSWYGSGPFPSMKRFLKLKTFNFVLLCGGGGSPSGWGKCKARETLSFDDATAEKLHLKDPVIDTISDTSPGKADGVCTSCYMFGGEKSFQLPNAVKRKLAKLKRATLVLDVDLTDTRLKEKSKWRTEIVIGAKKKPKPLAEV